MSVVAQTSREGPKGADARIAGAAAGPPTVVAAGILTIVLAAVYAPVMQADFLFRDDTVYLTLPRGWNLTPITLAQARPVMGLAIDCLNTSVVTGAGLKYVFPLVGLGLLATAICAWLRRNGVRVATALPLSIAACCLPAFQGMVPYLSVAVAIYAALASCLAIHVCLVPDMPRPGVRFCLASALVFAALSTYQPAAMFGWALALVPIFVAGPEAWPAWRRRLVLLGVLFGCTLVAYTVAYKVVLHGLGMTLSGRAETITPELLPVKLQWLATAYLPHTIRAVVTPLLAGFSPSSGALTIGAVLTVAGGLLGRVASGSVPATALQFLERMGWLGLSWLMTYLPFVVLRENGGEAIYATGLQTATLLALFLALRELIGLAGRWRGASAGPALGGEQALATVLCLCMATAAGGAVLRDVVFPGHNRYRAVVRAIAAGDLASMRQIYVVPDDALLGAYAEGLVRGVLNETCRSDRPPPVAAAFAAAPQVLHIAPAQAVERYGAAFHDYYSFDAVNQVYWLKPGLSPEQRAAADECFARFLRAAKAAPDSLVIDLSGALVGY